MPLLDSSLGTTYPLSQFLNYERFSPSFRALLASISSHFEPQYFSQAINDPKWREAMAKEISALEDNHTWEFTYLPPGKCALGCKWVYKIKYHANGTSPKKKPQKRKKRKENNGARWANSILQIIRPAQPNMESWGVSWAFC